MLTLRNLLILLVGVAAGAALGTWMLTSSYDARYQQGHIAGVIEGRNQVFDEYGASIIGPPGSPGMP